MADAPSTIDVAIWDNDHTLSAGVTSDNRLKTDSLISILSTLSTQIFGFDQTTGTFKKVLLKPFPTPSSNEGWLSIFGEVGSTTRAKNPIDFTIRKPIATTQLTPIIDKTVTPGKRWYITSLVFANDNASELQFYKGFSRAAVELFSGNGSQSTFTLTRQAIAHPAYITVKVGGTTKTLNADYTVEDGADDKKSNVVFKSTQTPPPGTNNIEITYDKVERRRDFFIQASSSFIDVLPTPIRLNDTEFFVGAIINKGGNAAISITTVGGFELDPTEDIF